MNSKIIVLDKNAENGHTELNQVECTLYDIKTQEDLWKSTVYFDFNNATCMKDFVYKVENGSYGVDEVIKLYARYENLSQEDLINQKVLNWWNYYNDNESLESENYIAEIYHFLLDEGFNNDELELNVQLKEYIESNKVA
ncbi:hypothetical protein [Poseidonibacter ostreae]|uniref:Uncharacterized protein n=1 Tax=Poseidonibacter ostreae TaxID=2654171 RepID=A0A6L4WY75_9BACT|nr:hypothetical protein [Poseidonibacter ostreae]KAB7891420.1 hypothetical protein GBG19_00865 [Poseidonibacter ostreae]